LSHKQRAIEAIGHIRDANKQPAEQRIASLIHIRDHADRAAQSLVPKLRLDSVTAAHVEQDAKDAQAVIDAEAKAVAAELDAERTDRQHRAWISNMETGGPAGRVPTAAIIADDATVSVEIGLASDPVDPDAVAIVSQSTLDPEQAIREDYAAPAKAIADAMIEHMGDKPKPKAKPKKAKP